VHSPENGLGCPIRVRLQIQGASVLPQRVAAVGSQYF
jgi:hypothetical protein